MVKAYVLIKSEPGQQGDIYTKVLKLKGVRNANTIIGPYDLIVFVESIDLANLGKMIVSKVQNLKGVKDTVTCVVIEPI